MDVDWVVSDRNILIPVVAMCSYAGKLFLYMIGG